jgi:rRNA maturation endonuclease Nob1
MSGKKVCCDSLAIEVLRGTIELNGDRLAAVGCCGGCYVLVDMIFCPFCGSRLPSTPASRAPSPA